MNLAHDRFCRLLGVAALWVLLAVCQSAAEAQPAPAEDAVANDAAMSQRVDELLEAQLRDSGWPPAELCSEATFLRRAHLDLTGTPPSASEVVEFVRDGDGDKRSDLIDRLLRSPAAASHLAETWAGWMLPEQDSPELLLGREGLQGWLRNRFAENLR